MHASGPELTRDADDAPLPAHAPQSPLATLQAIFEVMSEGVVLVDAAGRIELANAAFERMSGSLPGTLIGSPVAPLLGPRVPRADAPRLLGALAAAGEAVERTFWRHDGSAFTVRITVRSLPADDRPRWLAVLEDVSERNQLERAVLEIANRERNRIGSDLHDGLGQELTGIALLLRGLATRAARGDAPRSDEVEELLRLVNTSIETTRALAQGLAPVALAHDGLVSALKMLAAGADRSDDVEVRFEARGHADLVLDEVTATNLYRIAQESLTNALRHAGARHVTIRLHATGRTIRLSVSDDGRGLPRQAARAAGMGLRIMGYRARLIGGTIALHRRTAGGTRITCTVRSRPTAPGTAGSGRATTG